MDAHSPAPQDTANQLPVSDDWTRNWQAQIAVKIAAMFLWVLIIAAFGGVVYFTNNLERNLQNQRNDHLDALSHRLQSQLNQFSPSQLDQNQSRLLDVLRSEIDHTGASVIQLQFGDKLVEAGQHKANMVDSIRTLLWGGLGAMNSAGSAQRVTLKVFFPPISTLVMSERNHLILIVVAMLIALGMLLIWTIHNVLAKPLQELTDATRSVTDGNLDLRMDVSRQDEFGHLSRFFNQMLDHVQEQRLALTETNRELTQEISIRREADKLVETRTRDLEEARDEALKASKTKSDFIANISHEVRTPLTPIIGFAEAMIRDDQDAETRKSLLTSIIRNARHLLQIISQILDLSKIEANHLEVERIPVETLQILYDVETIVGVLAREKGLKFSVNLASPIPRVIHSDPTRIKQILLNILTNALKFTERGRVDLSFGFNSLTNMLEMTVSDTGVGIPKDKLDYLFKAFSQADSSTTRRFGGTGLGLYISQRLANLLGGDIRVESIDGVGANFYVTLDVGIPKENQDIVYEIVENVAEKIEPSLVDIDLRLSGHVLVAEDSPDNQKLIAYYIRKTGATLTLVENGRLALEAALSDDYDLILMDMQMPEMGGVEATELLRAAGCITPIYALTANAMQRDRELYLRIGCEGFLSKPIELDRFVAVLARHLRPLEIRAATVEMPPDEELLDLIAGFVQSLPGYAVRLQSAVESKVYEEVVSLAHQLKGMGGSFGFPEITRKAKVLEIEAKNREYDSLPRLAQELNQLLLEVYEQAKK